MTNLTKKHADILRHSLGADSRRPGYRNYFSAEAQTPDFDLCEDLAVHGFMSRGRIIDGLTNFHVTELGQAFVGVEYDND